MVNNYSPSVYITKRLILVYRVAGLSYCAPLFASDCSTVEVPAQAAMACYKYTESP